MITKTSIRLAIGSAFLACLMAGAQDKDSYTKAELQKEQNLFITYLRAATNELSAAKVRLFDKSECRLAGLATVQSLTQLDSSRFSQDGHLERIAKVASSGLLTANYNSKSLNESYLPIRTFGDEVENQINDFLKSFERTCPDWMWMIRQYQEAAQKIRQNSSSRADAVRQLQQIHEDIKNAGETGPVSFGANDPIGPFLTNPSAENRAKFVADVVAKGMSQDDAGALADAIASRNCAAIMQLLSKYPGQYFQDLLQRLKSDLCKGSMPSTSAPPPAAPGAGIISQVANPSVPASTLIPALVQAGLTPDDAKQFIDAVRSKDCATARQILAKYSGPAIDQMRQDLEAHCAQIAALGPVSGPGPGPGPGPVTTPGVETDSSDWGDFENGKRYKSLAEYPQGRSNGTLSMEHWSIQDQASNQIKTEDHPWELIIKAAGDRPAKNQDSFSVGNEQKGSNPENFAIDDWKLMKGDAVVQTGTDQTFAVTYPDGGEYQVVATGHTEPGVKLKKFGFTVRKTRRYNP